VRRRGREEKVEVFNVLEQLADGLDSWALIAAMFGVVIGAVVWGCTQLRTNSSLASSPALVKVRISGIQDPTSVRLHKPGRVIGPCPYTHVHESRHGVPDQLFEIRRLSSRAS
jgi:hypothetical protein